MKCTQCGTEIPKGQQVCPNCGQAAPQPTKKPITKKWWFWVLLAAVVLIVIAAAAGGGKKTDDAAKNASGGDQTPAADASDQKAPGGAEQKKEAYELGDAEIRTWTDSIGSKWIQVSFAVKNTGGKDLYLSSGTIDVEDASGALIDTLSMVSAYPQIVQPGETAYYYEETTFEGESTEGLKAALHPDIKVSSNECVRLAVSDVTLKDDSYFGVKALGRVENTTDEEQKLVYIVINMFDADGALLGQEFTILSNSLAPGEKISFETSSLGNRITAAEVASYEIYAFPNQYQF